MFQSRRTNKIEIEPPTYQWPTYTNEELDKFGKFLEPFFEERDSINPHTEMVTKVKVINREEAMVAYGSMKKWVQHRYTTYSIINDGQYPSGFQLFNHKLDAWKDRNFKRDFAAQKSAENLDEIIKNEPPPEAQPPYYDID